MLNEFINFALQIRHGVEGTAADRALRDQAEPALDLIKPGRISRCVVNMKTGAPSKPGFDAGMPVGAVVVDDQVNIQMIRNVGFNVTQEAQVLLMPVPRFALR